MADGYPAAMRRIFLLLPFAILAAGCGPSVVPAAQKALEAYSEVQLEELKQSLNESEARAKDQDLSAEDWRTADKELQQHIADPRFASLDSSDRAEAWYARGWAAFNADDNANARDRFRKALDIYDAEPWYWLSLAQSEMALKDKESAAASFAQAFGREPKLIPQFEERLFAIVDGTEPGSRSTLELLRVLDRNPWTSTDPRAGSLWRRLALEEMHTGNRAAAIAALGKISTPDTIVRVRMDKRFDGLYDRQSPAFDVDKVAAARIEFLEAQAKLHPGVLENRTELNRELLAFGKFQQVLDNYDAINEAIAAKPDDPPFEDMDQMAEIREQRGTALGHLGRKEESEQSLQRAAETEDDGEPNVNQALNLASKYCSDGDGAKSARALAKAGKSLSPYGSMVYHYIEHCAATLQGDSKTAESALAYLREHRLEGRLIYLRALLRVDRIDEAAQEAIARLDSEKLREDVLYSIQDFPDDGTDGDPGVVQLGWRKLLAREDVRAAVDRVGRIEQFPNYGY